MRQLINTLLIAAATLLATACKPDAVVPAESVDLQTPARIFPDYSNVVIPPNIAPLNFMMREEGSEFICQITSKDGRHETVTAAGTDGKFRIDTLEWRDILEASRGSDLEVNVYAHRGDKWMHYPAFRFTVAAEDIDPYLTYRLIEPSYELYRQLGIYERCLTNFQERPIYENGDTYSLNNNHCVNCHTPQQYGTGGNSLFHVRGDHGGTIFIHGDKVERINMKNDSTLGNAVYPAWHPSKPWIVFSSNLTGQAFHIMNSDKIEVIDYGSDLVFYDVEENRISNITKTTVEMETFPTWNPDGTRLYYCSATFPPLGEVPDTLKGEDHTLACSDSVISHFDEVRYRPLLPAILHTTPPARLSRHAEVRHTATHQPRRTMATLHDGRLRTIPHLAQDLRPIRHGPPGRRKWRGTGRGIPSVGGRQQQQRGELPHLEQQRTMDCLLFTT